MGLNVFYQRDSDRIIRFTEKAGSVIGLTPVSSENGLERKNQNERSSHPSD